MGGKRPNAEVRSMHIAPDLDVRVPFVGRDAHLAIIADSLLRSQLVTLCGAGGIGKSRLAYEVALRRSELHGQRSIWCALAGTQDGGVTATLAQALHIIPAPPSDIIDQIAQALDQNVSLLILDNCEHVRAEVAAIIKSVQARCAIRFLTTSRSRLRLSDEQVIEIPPFEEDEALAFLTARAALSTPHFALGSEDERAARNIVLRLDRLPLAIDLAAARLSEISMQELERSLDRLVPRNFRDNTTTEHRHRSLRSVVAWSGQLVSADARYVLACVSLFADAFEREDAAALSGYSDELRLDAALDELREQSLIGIRRDEKFLVLVPVRTVAVTWITDVNDRLRVRERMCGWLAEIAQRVLDGYAAGDSLAALAVLNQRHGDFITSLTWILDHPAMIPRYSQIIFALTAIWSDGGRSSEGRPLLERALACCPDDDHLKGRLLYARARVALADGDYSLMGELGPRLIATFSRLGDHLMLARSHSVLCNVCLHVGNMSDASMHGETAMRLYDVSKHPRGIATAHINLGNIALDANNEIATAITHYTSAIEICSEHGFASEEMLARTNLALALLIANDATAARLFADEAIRSAEALGNRAMMAKNEQTLAYIAILESDDLRAIDALERSLILLDSSLHLKFLTDAAEGVVEVACRAGRREEANTLRRAECALRTHAGIAHFGALTQRAMRVDEAHALTRPEDLDIASEAPSAQALLALARETLKRAKTSFLPESATPGEATRYAEGLRTQRST